MAPAPNHSEHVPYPCGPSAPWRPCHAFQAGNTKRGGLDIRVKPTAEHLVWAGPMPCFRVPNATSFLPPGLPGPGAGTEAAQDPMAIESGLSDTSAGTCSSVPPTRAHSRCSPHASHVPGAAVQAPSPARCLHSLCPGLLPLPTAPLNRPLGALAPR